MVKTEIINRTGNDLSLKEGNAGVFRDIKKIPKGDSYFIEIDTNATYREYVAVSTPSGDKVFVNSDDCVDNATITVFVENGIYKFKGTPRSDASPNEGGASTSFFSKIWKKIVPSKK